MLIDTPCRGSTVSRDSNFPWSPDPWHTEVMATVILGGDMGSLWLCFWSLLFSGPLALLLGSKRSSVPPCVSFHVALTQLYRRGSWEQFCMYCVFWKDYQYLYSLPLKTALLWLENYFACCGQQFGSQHHITS